MTKQLGDLGLSLINPSIARHVRWNPPKEMLDEVGRSIDLRATKAKMHPELLARLEHILLPCTHQNFLKCYIANHAKAFDEQFHPVLMDFGQ